MTDFHHSHLDDHPDDAAARLLLAEHLDERGDPDAAGYRWMAEMFKYPHRTNGGHGWRWYSGLWTNEVASIDRDVIPINWLESMFAANRNNHCHNTRRAAEASLCRAVATLENSSQD